jgi:large subunit ribosomal protein L30e
MNLTNEIQQALKANKVVLGYKESIKILKKRETKKIILAKNTPENLRKLFEHNAKIFNIPVEIFDGSSKDLGVLCGKPFPVSVLALRS